MRDYMSRRAQGITPYVPGEQPKTENLIKLNTNENPYPPSQRVREAILEQVDKLRLYPQIDGETLRLAIARRENLSPEHVFVGNGSDEVLSLCFPAFFNEDKPVYFPQVTYTFYSVFAQLFGIPVRRVPMRDGLHVDVEGLLAGGPVLLANPNAPTTRALPLDTLRQMADRLLSREEMLIVDEAYVAFGAQSALPLIADHPNLLVVRTFSKDHSLAGLRVGYALGQPHLIEALRRVKDSFNSYPLDRLAIAGATAAVEDEAYFLACRDAILRTRDRFAAQLEALGFMVEPSSANFLFARHRRVAGKQLFDALRAQRILVRRFDQPEIADYLRITIGTDAQMEQVVQALQQILNPR